MEVGSFLGYAYQKEALANNVSKDGVGVFGVGIISMAWLEIQFDRKH